MPPWQFQTWALHAVWLLFVIALGACAGSLINVLAHRMPLGISVVRPPSRCPACGVRLTWRENIPVFGWLLLRGRCRTCKAPISPEYPIVEASVALLFGLLYTVCYIVEPQWSWLGVQWGAVRPEWSFGWVEDTWLIFVIVLAIFGSLAAMTIVDAKTFTIPLALAWFPAVVGAIVHPAWAWWIDRTGSGVRASAGWDWAIATPGPFGWELLGAAIGGVGGLGAGLVLVRTGLIRRSFEDYEDWERDTFAAESAEPQDPALVAEGDPARAKLALIPRIVVLVLFVLTPIAGAILAPVLGYAAGVGLIVGALAGPIAAGLANTIFRGRRPAPGTHESSPPHMWTKYPHARREMIREMAFLGPCVLLAVIGRGLALHLAGPWHIDAMTGNMVAQVSMPLWLSVLGGVLMGYLIGGGVVWAVRIFGSLAFGKEAMGLGDVHLMAAVGVCLGWIDSVLAFFLAAFVGVYWAILGRLFTGGMARAMPYGPFLAVATLLIFIGKPAIEWALATLTGAPGPITLP